MKTAIATALTAAALVGIASTPAQAQTSDSPSVTTTQLSAVAQDDGLRSTVEFTCPEGYTYQVASYAFNARSTYGLAQEATKKNSGTCTGKVQKARLRLQLAGLTAVPPEGPFTVVSILTLSDGPCVTTDVDPDDSCVVLGFDDFTV